MKTVSDKAEFGRLLAEARKKEKGVDAPLSARHENGREEKLKPDHIKTCPVCNEDLYMTCSCVYE